MFEDRVLSAPFGFGIGQARLLGIMPQIGLAPIGFDAFDSAGSLVITVKCRPGTLSPLQASHLLNGYLDTLKARLVQDAAALPAPLTQSSA